MSRRGWGYLAYTVGSIVFIVTAVLRGSPLLMLGSALFLIGTLCFAVPEVVRELRVRRRLVGPSGEDDD